MLTRMSVSLFLAFCISCNSQATTNELLGAEFLTRGASNIILVSPADKATVTGKLVLAWSPVAGLEKYRVEVAADANFQNVLVDKIATSSFTEIVNADFKAGYALDSFTYFWRVSVPYAKTNLRSPSRSANLLAAEGSSDAVNFAVYVNSAASATDQTGTKNAPFKTIVLATKFIDVFRGADVSRPVAVRMAQGNYSETILLPAGISLLGGYNPSDWSRNISTFVTNWTAPLDIAIRVEQDATLAYRSTTVIEGLRLIAGSVFNSKTGIIQLTNASPTIRNNTFVLHPTAQSQGIFINNGSPLISGNSVTASHGTNGSVFIQCDGATAGPMTGSLSIQANVISGTGYGNVFELKSCGAQFSQNSINISRGDIGINIDGAGTQALDVQRNTILISDAALQGRGIFTQSNPATISNNLIQVKSTAASSCAGPSFAPVTAIGVFSDSPKISNNTLVADAPSCIAVLNDQNNSSFTATNNILIAQTASTRNCYRNQATPDTLNNNIYINCTDAPSGSNTTLTFAGANFSGGTTYTFGMALKLTASSAVGARTGGIDTSGVGLGSVTLDNEGLSRTLPYSIGAYELD